MRIAFISSIFLALMVGFSSVIHAAPSVEATEPVVAAQVASDAQVVAINLNTADEATLQRELSGVGAVKAKAIVAYREANGDFTSADELLEVKGIGKAIFEKNRDKVAVKYPGQLSEESQSLTGFFLFVAHVFRCVVLIASRRYALCRGSCPLTPCSQPRVLEPVLRPESRK